LRASPLQTYDGIQATMSSLLGCSAVLLCKPFRLSASCLSQAVVELRSDSFLELLRSRQRHATASCLATACGGWVSTTARSDPCISAASSCSWRISIALSAATRCLLGRPERCASSGPSSHLPVRHFLHPSASATPHGDVSSACRHLLFSHSGRRAFASASHPGPASSKLALLASTAVQCRAIPLPSRPATSNYQPAVPGRVSSNLTHRHCWTAATSLHLSSPVPFSCQLRSSAAALLCQPRAHSGLLFQRSLASPSPLYTASSVSRSCWCVSSLVPRDG